MIPKNDIDYIESLVDGHGLTAVVDALADICYGKAAHILESYQDTALAAKWDQAGRSLVNPKTPTTFPT